MAIGSTFVLSFDSKAVQKGLASVAQRMKNLGTGALSGIIQPFTQLSALLAPAALVGGMYAFGKASSDSASQMENLIAQFELFTGSADKAQGLIADLRKTAVNSPLEMADIAEGARNLLTYGVEARKVARITDQLSEVSAGNGEIMGRLTYAFGQISSIGHLAGTELKQLTEAGFNPLEYIMKRTGETMLQVRDRMSKSLIPISEVEQALDDATSAGGRFYGLNDKMSKTFSGRVSMMKDQWAQLTASFGEGMNSGLKVAIDAVTNGLPMFKEQFKKMGDALGDAIGEAVAGDTEKLTKIGDLIGSTILAGIKASLQAGSGGLLESVAGMNQEFNVLPGGKKLGGFLKGQIQENRPSYQDLLEANMTNAGIRDKASAIMNGGRSTGYVPSPSSPKGREDAISVWVKSTDRIVAELKKLQKAGSTL